MREIAKRVSRRLDSTEYAHLKQLSIDTGLKMEPVIRRLIVGAELRPRPPGELTELLRRVVADGTRSVLFSTHITSDLEKCATHIAFIKDGELQYTGSLDDFRTHYKDVGATLENIIVHVERRPLDEDAII